MRLAALSAALLLAGAVGGGAQQRGQDQITLVQEGPGPSLTEVEAEATMIGMEAYREVLLSGQYLVGPGDEFMLHVSEMDEPVLAKVLAEGGLFVPKVGRIHVGGMHLREAREAIGAAFRQTVRVGTVEVELSRPRTFPVAVVGMVKTPGIIVTSGVERVGQVLERAGGVKEEGSTRNVQILRTGNLSPGALAALKVRLQQGDFSLPEEVESRRVDLAMYEATGDSRLNCFVEDGDVIVVPPRLSVMRALESVNRPGEYEYVPGDRLRDLAALAMGPAAASDTANVLVFRYAAAGTRQVSMPVSLTGAMAGDEAANIELQAEDWLVARPRPDYQISSTVRLMGEVRYPGFYVIDKSGSRVREVIERAGGFTERAALGKARVLRNVPSEQMEEDRELVRILTIPPVDWSDDEKQYYNMKSREQRGRMVVDFVGLFEEGDEEQDIRLLPGDVIMVPSLQHTVLVSGQAAYPGAVSYSREYGVDDYIDRAGGFGWRASKDVRVIKARTGEIIGKSDVKDVEPGDRIWIKEKPVRDYWGLFTEGMTVAGQVATIVLLFVTIQK